MCLLVLTNQSAEVCRTRDSMYDHNQPVYHIPLISTKKNHGQLPHIKTGPVFHNLISIDTMKWNLPNILNTNLRSLTKKVDELTAVLQINYIDVAVVTESWLDEDIPDSSVNITGYKPIRNDMYGQRGGGLIVFVR